MTKGTAQRLAGPTQGPTGPIGAGLVGQHGSRLGHVATLWLPQAQPKAFSHRVQRLLQAIPAWCSLFYADRAPRVSHHVSQAHHMRGKTLTGF